MGEEYFWPDSGKKILESITAKGKKGFEIHEEKAIRCQQFELTKSIWKLLKNAKNNKMFIRYTCF